MSGNDTDEESDLSVFAEEHIEIMSTEDERIKIIGEELANDTGRAIFGKISQGISSSNDLAKALNVSLPLVTWHINRLLSVGLIKIEKIEMSSKNKKMKYYGPVKTALVIIPPENPNDGAPNSKKDTILMKLRHYIASFAAAIVGGATIYMVGQGQTSQQPPSANLPQETAPQAASSIHAAIKTAPLAAPETSPASSIFIGDQTLMIISIICGAAIFFAVFFGIWFAKKSKDKKLKHKQQSI
ncbi:MAG TPA: winged helix-turn-helix domain-containing protein [Candidatus Bathyarchaeia archaeon]|nr:winged helix-turn-helix domain-containing protein [Candidatus Bathyarchaeia archaeon]